MAWAATADQARPEAIKTEAKSLFIRSLQTTLGLSPSAIQFRRTDGPAILVKSSRHSNSSNEADADVYFGSKADMRSRVTSVWVISGHDAFNVRSALHPKSQKNLGSHARYYSQGNSTEKNGPPLLRHSRWQ